MSDKAIRAVFEKHTMPEAGDPELILFDTEGVINDLTQLLANEVRKAETRARIEGADDKLKTLADAAAIMDFCEDDLNKILIWVKNHRWSLIAPAGKNTQGETTND